MDKIKILRSRDLEELENEVNAFLEENDKPHIYINKILTFPNTASEYITQIHYTVESLFEYDEEEMEDDEIDQPFEVRKSY
nr:MAG TPA: Sporulation protein Cse60 [Caudoviricetes sp.]